MFSFFFVLACLATPPLLMWWMVRVQRRVRTMARKPETPYSQPYEDEVRAADGLSYGRRFNPNDELISATHASDARTFEKDIQGIR